MIRGYERGLEAKESVNRYVTNPYPEWCAEAKRFDAGRDGKPDPNDAK